MVFVIRLQIGLGVRVYLLDSSDTLFEVGGGYFDCEIGLIVDACTRSLSVIKVHYLFYESKVNQRLIG